jgi:hypothetical protein
MKPAGVKVLWIVLQFVIFSCTGVVSLDNISLKDVSGGMCVCVCVCGMKVSIFFHTLQLFGSVLILFTNKMTELFHERQVGVVQPYVSIKTNIRSYWHTFQPCLSL